MSAPGAPAARALRNTRGERVVLRRAQHDDVLLIADLLYRLSERTRRLRYFAAPPPTLPRAWAEARRIARQPAERYTALLATVHDERGLEEVVGVAELARDPRQAGAAEFGIVVRDDYQRTGVGSALGRLAVEAARAQGIRALHSDVLAENYGVQKLLGRLGELSLVSGDGAELHVVVQVPPRWSWLRRVA